MDTGPDTQDRGPGHVGTYIDADEAHVDAEGWWFRSAAGVLFGAGHQDTPSVLFAGQLVGESNRTCVSEQDALRKVPTAAGL
jgi:hypothetical protein